MILDKILIDKNKNIIDALNMLNDIKSDDDISKLILFVKSKSKIIGTITDGDIRRNLILEKNITKKVKDICNKKFHYLNNTDIYKNFDVYRQNKITVLPVLDKKKSLIKIIDLNKIKSNLPIECVIMAGGRGKRLSPLTDSTPKPMLRINGIPIIEYIIDSVISYGIKRIYISIGYLGYQISEYFGNGRKKGIEIVYINEDIPLGTIGSISNYKFKSENILLINSDVLTNFNIESMYLKFMKSKSSMTIGSKEYRVDVPYGVLELKSSKLKSLREKPTYKYLSNSGIYMFKKDLVKLIPKNTFFNATDLIELLLKTKHKITNHEIDGIWHDIGSPDNYNNAKKITNFKL
jgi:dTDP-glucose pyrophosphorylase